MVRSADEVMEIARKTVALLQERIPVLEAWLFGSYVEGQPHEYSDIDLAVFSPAVDSMTFMQRVDLIVAVEMEAGEDVEVHLFPESGLRNARPSNMYGHVRETGKRVA